MPPGGSPGDRNILRICGFTVDYDVVEDRVRLDATGRGETGARVYLTRRILDRIIDAMVANIEASAAETGFETGEGQGAATRGRPLEDGGARLSPVRLAPDAPTWLCRTAHIETAPSRFRVTFRGIRSEAAVLELAGANARAFLDVAWIVYCKGQWPLAVFPDWLGPRGIGQAGSGTGRVN